MSFLKPLQLHSLPFSAVVFGFTIRGLKLTAALNGPQTEESLQVRTIRTPQAPAMLTSGIGAFALVALGFSPNEE